MLLFCSVRKTKITDMSSDKESIFGFEEDFEVVEFTEEQISDFKASGRDYVGDWYSWQKDKDKALAEFDGQFEAIDMAMGELRGVQAECAASYIYEGMCEKVEEIRKEKSLHGISGDGRVSDRSNSDV